MTWQQSQVHWYQRTQALFFWQRNYSGFGNVYYNRCHVQWDPQMSAFRKKRLFRQLGREIRESGLSFWLVQQGFPMQEWLEEWGMESYHSQQLPDLAWRRGVEQLLGQKTIDNRLVIVADERLEWLDPEKILWLATHFTAVAVVCQPGSRWELLQDQMMEEEGLPLTRVERAAFWKADLVLALHESDLECNSRPAAPVWLLGEKEGPSWAVTGVSYEMEDSQRRLIPQGVEETDYLGLLWEEYGVEEAGKRPVSAYVAR
ncbi:MAG: hypothetical protein ACOX7F_04110 [Eubacteriales bacterium]